jgi:hypothetical protein
MTMVARAVGMVVPAAVAIAWLTTPACAADARALHALIAAYPEFLDRIDGNELVWRDGTRMAIEDGIADKTFEQLLNAPDIGDQFAFPYPLAMPKESIPVNADPGRVRYEPLFVKMYGDCKKGAVRGKLKSITWLPKKYGRTIRVTAINGVADKLAAVSRELDALPARFNKFLFPPAGVYSCRVIAGTGRKSVHSFAAAIDLNVKQANYWRWTKPDASGRYRYGNRMPREIVEIFERHGFIWGGKWYHYDTMHFEYRPELIALARGR